MRPCNKQACREVADAIWREVYGQVEAIAPHPLAAQIADEVARLTKKRMSQTIFAERA